jgi:long-chain acyl-CoA synthetase
MLKDKPWLHLYDKGVQHHLNYPNMCVHELLGSIHPEKKHQVAIIKGEQCISFAELDILSTNFAAHLITLGVEVGNVVGICLPNSIEFVIAFLGILKSGAVVAAMNPSFPKRELQFQVNQTHLRYVITTQEKLEDFNTMQLDEYITNLIIAGNGQSESKDRKKIWFDDLIGKPEDQLSLPIISPDQPAVAQFSGGTTGIPKAALGSHRNLVANVTQFRNWLVNLEDGKETFLIAIPLYHVYGLVLGLILGIATTARMIFLEQPGNIDEILHAIRQFPISYFPAVPSIFSRITAHPDVVQKKVSLSTIKACISGSAPLLTSVREDFEKKSGGFLVEGYGLSEAPTATHCNPIIGEKRNGSIGLPLPDVDCRITMIAEEQQDVQIGEEGELWVRGPQVMMGYLDQPEENQYVLCDGWLRTGDVARMDEDGFFFLSGRMKELIKVHGMQVWPYEIEEVVGSHPSILECAAAGIPNQYSGESVKVWVVLRPGTKLTLDDIIVFCRDKLVAYKIPTKMEIRDSLPRTAVGKILRRFLVDEELKK